MGPEMLCMKLICADVIKKAVEKAASSRHSTTHLKCDHPLVYSTCQACAVYLTAMETLTQLRLNIVAGMISRFVVMRGFSGVKKS